MIKRLGSLFIGLGVALPIIISDYNGSINLSTENAILFIPLTFGLLSIFKFLFGKCPIEFLLDRDSKIVEKEIQKEKGLNIESTFAQTQSPTPAKEEPKNTPKKEILIYGANYSENCRTIECKRTKATFDMISRETKGNSNINLKLIDNKEEIRNKGIEKIPTTYIDGVEAFIGIPDIKDFQAKINK